MNQIIFLIFFALCGAEIRQKITIHEHEPAQVQRERPSHPQSTRFRSTAPPVQSRACAPNNLLRIEFTPSRDGDGRIYGNIFGTGVFLASSSDVFEYEMMWLDEQCNCGAEFEVGSVYRLRDHGSLDDEGFSPHSERNANMTKRVFGRWFRRSWSMSAVDGKYVDKFVVSAFTTPGKTVAAVFKFIRVVQGSTVRRVVFDSGSEPPSVSSYFPGTIVTSCQPEVFISGEIELQNAVGVTSEKVLLTPGSTVMIRGFITSKVLGEESSNPHMCRWFTCVYDELRFLAFGDQRIRIVNVRIEVRHHDFPLTLIQIYHLTGLDRLIFPPIPIATRFAVPVPSQLSHLLNSSVLEIVAEHSSLVDGEWGPNSRTTLQRYVLGW